MRGKIIILLSLMVLAGVLSEHPALAHNFVQNSNADLIAKIQEFKVETNLIANNISNNTLAQWHVSKSQEYIGSNDIGTLAQKDPTLSNNLSTAIDELYSLAGQPNADPATASQKASSLSQILDQVESEEISTADQNNATIQSLALVNVVNQALKDYGDAIGSTVDLTNMSNMNMGSSSGNMQGMSGMQSSGNMQGMSSTTIVNDGDYQSAQALTNTAQVMFNNLKSISPTSSSPYLDKIDSALTSLKQAIDSKESGDDVMMIVHMQIHPNLISAFNIQSVPEFPIPVLLAIVSFIGIVAISKIPTKIK
ncbi:MAG TPA: hypothetical protein VEJ68_05265 [Candidatus Bathyarchaeia archaeon]|nr:hypothetical protein [Candidatus Bathyarchaeia archaeon]